MTDGIDPNLTHIGEERMDRILEIAREHDPDLIGVLVLHGAPDRGMALSYWTDGEGPEAEDRGLSHMAMAILQSGVQMKAERDD